MERFALVSVLKYAKTSFFPKWLRRPFYHIWNLWHRTTYQESFIQFAWLDFCWGSHIYILYFVHFTQNSNTFVVEGVFQKTIRWICFLTFRSEIHHLLHLLREFQTHWIILRVWNQQKNIGTLAFIQASFVAVLFVGIWFFPKKFNILCCCATAREKSVLGKMVITTLCTSNGFLRAFRYQHKICKISTKEKSPKGTSCQQI